MTHDIAAVPAHRHRGTGLARCGTRAVAEFGPGVNDHVGLSGGVVA